MKTLFLIITSFTFLTAFSQEKDSIMRRPVQVSFFYPLGSNGINSPKYSNYISLNMLYGINGGVDGFELGGLVNVNNGNVNGMQIGGIANVTKGHANGLIISGITNLASDSSNTMSFAGISNIYNANALGMQFAGISNSVNGTFLGGQFAGITNAANGDLNGAQVAGISNFSNGNLMGLQIAGISNLSNGNVNGGQIGLVNVAKNISGFQLGLINLAESYEKGIPIGLINIVKKGFHAIEISGTEAIYANLALKLGVNQFYGIYRAGYFSNGSEQSMSYGLGFGSMLSLTEKAYVSADLTANQIYTSIHHPELNLLSRIDLAFRYEFTKTIGLFAGPSFNVFISENPLDGQSSALEPPYYLYEESWWNNQGKTSIWIGGNLGLSVRF
ncbi:hypothetical protein [Crocinitomix algicola]|uniref:hypothetical protein n=1 Tax=Crocinitomix algicola TaxID=1740263 RepID=UPI00082C8765|nr:hypothetical protein [Crocinitomix algicola]